MRSRPFRVTSVLVRIALVLLAAADGYQGARWSGYGFVS